VDSWNSEENRPIVSVPRESGCKPDVLLQREKICSCIRFFRALKCARNVPGDKMIAQWEGAGGPNNNFLIEWQRGKGFPNRWQKRAADVVFEGMTGELAKGGEGGKPGIWEF